MQILPVFGRSVNVTSVTCSFCLSSEANLFATRGSVVLLGILLQITS